MIAASVAAAFWTLLMAALLLGWPWLLALAAGRRPAWFRSLEPPGRHELARAWDRLDRPRWREVGGWSALVTLAGILPVAPGGVAADLDAGLLWAAVLAVAIWCACPAPPVDGARLGAAALALVGASVPVVVRVASLDLTDVVVAQQGGAGNWFLIREPFLVVSALVFLVTTAAVWSRTTPRSAGTLLATTVRLGLPLVAAGGFAILFLGGWWAFVPFLDGAPWLNSLVKTLVVYGVLLWLRGRTTRADLALRWMPLVGVVAALGSLAWLVIGGGAR
ncbi:hypothetical protein GF314_10565 [bacterium]|nr:hypothetical protein [bacterium]